MPNQPFKLHHISAKNLGSLAMPDCCPRCFWIRARMGFKGPWSVFPSIFSHIDSFTKKVTAAHLASRAAPPQWLLKFGRLAGRIPCPHWSKFAFEDSATGTVLRGSPDEMFWVEDGTLAILDYKTARFTEREDELLPVYRVQLGGYRWLARKTGLGETSVTGLIYYEPATESATMADIVEGGFRMGFAAHILPVETDLAEVERLLLEANRIASLPVPPEGIKGCKDCGLVDEIRALDLA